MCLSFVFGAGLICGYLLFRCSCDCHDKAGASEKGASE